MVFKIDILGLIQNNKWSSYVFSAIFFEYIYIYMLRKFEYFTGDPAVPKQFWNESMAYINWFGGSDKERSSSTGVAQFWFPASAYRFESTVLIK